MVEARGAEVREGDGVLEDAGVVGVGIGIIIVVLGAVILVGGRRCVRGVGVVVVVVCGVSRVLHCGGGKLSWTGWVCGFVVWL